jgi:hypothetical protein
MVKGFIMSHSSVDSLLDAVKQLPPGELDEFTIALPVAAGRSGR